MIVEVVGPRTSHALRLAVLWPEAATGSLPDDDDPWVLHLGARDGAGRVVGTVRLHPAACAWRPEARAAWQLRAMATDPAVRGSGLGRELVRAGLARVGAAGGDLVWCDARATAEGFYRGLGFTTVTGAYERNARRHVGMVRAT